jgi:hypothetical protein
MSASESVPLRPNRPAWVDSERRSQSGVVSASLDFPPKAAIPLSAKTGHPASRNAGLKRTDGSRSVDPARKTEKNEKGSGADGPSGVEGQSPSPYFEP